MKNPHPIETLENRIAPAGAVLVEYDAATGALTLTGDGADNVLDVFRTGATSVRVEGFDGTSLQLGAEVADFFDFPKLTRITLDMGAGIDDVVLTNLTLNSADLSMGPGTDFLAAINVNVKGETSINHGADGGEAFFRGSFTNLGNLTASSESGNASVTLEALTTTIKGGITINGGSGEDGLFGSGEGSISIAKGVLMNGGDGANRIGFEGRGGVKIGKTASGQSIDFNGGVDSDELTLAANNVALAGFIDFSGGGGSNRLAFLGSDGVGRIGASTLGASILFTGGDGNDELLFEGGNATLAGGIDFDGGVSGDNFLTIDHDGVVRIGKLKESGNSIDLLGGDGADEIFLGGSLVTLAGGISLEGFGGSDVLDVDGANVIVGFGLTGRSISFNAGDDGDSLDLEGGRITLKGDLSFIGGGAGDFADLTDIHLFTGRGISFDGGAGDDSFELEADLVKISANVELLGATGNDRLHITANGQFKQNVTIDLEDGDGNQFASVFEGTGLPGALQIMGNLSIFSFGDALSTDEVLIQDIVVRKNPEIDLGDGESYVGIDNLTARGALKILTQGGEDLVEFERSGLFGPSVVSKVAEIDLGDGNDELRLGNSLVAAVAAHNRVRFLAAVTLKGGAGANILNADYEDANSFAVPPTVTGFL